MTKLFTGDKYSTDEFAPDERAQLRELHSVLSKNFLVITASQLQTIQQLDTMKRAWPLYLACAAAAVVLKQWSVL